MSDISICAKRHADVLQMVFSYLSLKDRDFAAYGQTDNGTLCTCLQRLLHNPKQALAILIRLFLFIMSWYPSYSWQHMRPCCLMLDEALGTMTNMPFPSLTQNV